MIIFQKCIESESFKMFSLIYSTFSLVSLVNSSYLNESAIIVSEYLLCRGRVMLVLKAFPQEN